MVYHKCRLVCIWSCSGGCSAIFSSSCTYAFYMYRRIRCMRNMCYIRWLAEGCVYGSSSIYMYMCSVTFVHTLPSMAMPWLCFFHVVARCKHCRAPLKQSPWDNGYLVQLASSFCQQTHTNTLSTYEEWVACSTLHYIRVDIAHVCCYCMIYVYVWVKGF